MGGINKICGSEFGDTLRGSNNPANTAELFEGRGGDDFIDGQGGFDRAVYLNEDHLIIVHLAAGDVFGGVNTGHDTLRSIEGIQGTQFDDTYDATGFTSTSVNGPNFASSGTFNEFEGAGGNDTITGNGNTRIAYYNATDGVTVILGTSGSGSSISRASFNIQAYFTAHDPTADPSDVGSDTIVSGVSQVRGSAFSDNITGNGGNNTLDGQGGDDVLSGGGGNDTLIGGSGADRFSYTTGNTIVTDFDQGEGAFNQNEADRIDLRNVGIVSFAALLPKLSEDASHNSIITISAGNTITIQGVANAQLQDFDFFYTGQVSINDLSSNGFDFGALYDDIAGVDFTLTAHDATHYIVANPTAGLIFSLISNSGFTYDGSGNPTGGNVNTIAAFDSSYHVLSGLNGFNFSLTSYLSAANAFTTTHDPSLLDAMLYNNPTVHYSAVGSSQGENNNGNFGGDTFVSSVNGDVFDGRTNFNGDFLGGDTVDYSHTPGPSGVTVSLAATGPQNTGGSGIDELINIENLRGSNFADTLTGSGNNNVLEGGPGNDTLIGGSGSVANVTASYEHAPAGPGNLGVTVDLTNLGPQNTVEAGTDTLTNIQNLRGSAFNDTLTGNGSSVLEGGQGADHLIGQSGGSDVASYDHASAGVTVNLFNTAQNTGDATGDTFTFINNVRGSSFNDHITGNNSANVLDGGFGGNDQFTGMGGADTFVFHGGHLTITDFNQGEGDLIDVAHYQGNGLSAQDLTALIAASSGSELSLGNGNVIEMPGMDVHLLTANNFIHS